MTNPNRIMTIQTSPLKILIVEDHPIVISGYRALYSGHDEPEIIEAHTADDAIAIYPKANPDVAIVDINLPDDSGFSLTRRLRKIDRDARVLIFTMSDGPALALQAKESGALGFISKTDNPIKIKEAVSSVAAGEMWFPAEILQEMAMLQIDTDGDLALTGRHIDIVRLLGHGRSLSEIASTLGVSYKTIVLDCSSLRERFGARTNGELVRIATEHKLI